MLVIMTSLSGLAPALVQNSKRQQLEVNERQEAGDGFMLNLVSVLQLLCAKVKQDKVDPVYLCTDTCSLSLDTTDGSRLMSTCKDYKE